MSDCNHTKDEKKTAELVHKHLQIMHKITTKMITMIKATEKEINHINFNRILTIVMREINKNSGLHGFEKKDLVILIIEILLQSVGLEPIVASYTTEIIECMIEHCYHAGLHRYKRPHKWRFWK